MNDAYMLPAVMPGRNDMNVNSAGVITDKVYVKSAPDTPELPMPGALVLLLKLDTGRMVWRGLCDEAGDYSVAGLAAGAAYVPVAVDTGLTYECVAAGPVVAKWQEQG